MRRIIQIALLVWCTILQAQAPLNLANMDLNAIDRSCKPCDDFYQFSIGKWNAEQPIPATQVRWSKRWAGASNNQQILKEIAEGLAARKSPAGTHDQLVGDFYGSCMDSGAVNSAGAKLIEAALERIAAISTAAALQTEIARLHQEAIGVGFVLGPYQDNENPRQTIAGIVPGRLGLPDAEYYLKDDARSVATRERYSQHLQTLLKLAGWTAENAAPAAKNILAMETAFAREQLTRVERRDPYKVTTHMPASKLAELTPHFDWAAYYRALGLPMDGVVNVADLKYMREFDRQLHETPLDQWKQYLAVNLVRAVARDLSAPFQQEMFEFAEKHLGGQSEPGPRSKFCVERADVHLGDALGKAYVEKMFPPAAKARMQEMVKYLMAALKESIEGLEWMTDPTRQKALAKLAAFQTKIGYPDKWKSYAGLTIARASYLENVRAAARLAERNDIARINKPTDRAGWRMTAPTSNAYYSPVGNEIVFPAGILVPPLFSLDADDAVNYGSIGVIIGHEISHGFDDQGSQFDADGRLKNWWTPEDRKQFLDRAACVIDQFNSYFIEPGVAHNGKLVLGEAIGDLAGARLAYAAYMKSLEGKPKQAIGGFTPEQRFFIGWGQARGDNVRIEQQRRLIVTDTHPIAKFRVIGPLSNMVEFRKAFGCQEGDPMVRTGAKLCRIW